MAIQVSGRLVDRLPPLLVIGPGVAVATLAQGALLLQLGPDTPAWRLVVTSVVAAFGAGFVLLPTTTVATRWLEPAAIPSGSTLLSVVSHVSSAVCIAAASVLLSDQLARRADTAAAFQAAWVLPGALMSVAGVAALVVLRRPAPRRTGEQVPAADSLT